MTIDLSGYDPADSEAQQNPFPHYARLRRDNPVFRHPELDVYFVARYDTVREVLADPHSFSSKLSNAATMPSDPQTLVKLAKIASKGWLPPAATLVTADPPNHTRYRKAVAPLLAPKRIRALEPRIRAVASELLDAWPAQGRVDFRNQFALAMPVRVISQVLGAKPGMEGKIEQWADDAVVAIGVDVEEQVRLDAMQGIVDMQHYWVEELEARKLKPQEDIISELLAVRVAMEGEEGHRELDRDELLSIIIQLQVAGKEATTKGLMEIVMLLATHPEEWKRVRENPERIPDVVEEGLRYASPNQGLYRDVLKDVVLDGVPVPAGSKLWVMFGSANRDEGHFPDPDRFDPDRPNLRESLAFGVGAHFCVGAGLARAELCIAIEEIARRYRVLRLAEGASLRYESSFILRGLESLELEVA